MIGPILRAGRAPAMPAAIWLIAGIALGAWSLTGTTGAVILVLLAAGLLVLAAPRERSPIVARFAFAVFWLSLGFASGLARIARPATEARETFRALPEGADAVVRLEGVLVDFWSGLPPRARSRSARGAAPGSEGGWRVFPADVSSSCRARRPPERAADRGDRVASRRAG